MSPVQSCRLETKQKMIQRKVPTSRPHESLFFFLQSSQLFPFLLFSDSKKSGAKQITEQRAGRQHVRL